MRLQEQNTGKIEIYGRVFRIYVSTLSLEAKYKLAK